MFLEKSNLGHLFQNDINPYVRILDKRVRTNGRFLVRLSIGYVRIGLFLAQNESSHLNLGFILLTKVIFGNFFF